jgi:hypothetical protein
VGVEVAAMTLAAADASVEEPDVDDIMSEDGDVSSPQREEEGAVVGVSIAEEEEEEQEEEEEEDIVTTADGGGTETADEAADEEEEEEAAPQDAQGMQAPPQCSQGGQLACSICLEATAIGGPHQVSSLSCGHCFGHACIAEWLTRKKRGNGGGVVGGCRGLALFTTFFGSQNTVRFD